MSVVNEMINEISGSISQKISSHKDEVRVMKAMLNDTDYHVTLHTNSGETDYCPAEEFKSMCASIISSAAKVTGAEAANMMKDYSVKNSEAEKMVGISKEFITTYLHTGRKLPLGGHDKSNISLAMKTVGETVRSCPHKTSVDAAGNAIYTRQPTVVKEHDSIRVYAPCPPWVK